VNLVVNDRPVSIPEASTIRDLLLRLEVRTEACAVEVNRALVPGRCHGEHRLAEGDRVEIVTLVGGG
jgi:sulfur carrier protein